MHGIRFTNRMLAPAGALAVGLLAACSDSGPMSPNDPLGGETYWVTNAEYVHVLFGPVKGVGFIDAGSMSAIDEGFSFDSPELAVGLGVRIDLPVGPIRLEYGHNLTKDENESSGIWHFAIGVAF